MHAHALAVRRNVASNPKARGMCPQSVRYFRALARGHGGAGRARAVEHERARAAAEDHRLRRLQAYADHMVA